MLDDQEVDGEDPNLVSTTTTMEGEQARAHHGAMGNSSDPGSSSAQTEPVPDLLHCVGGEVRHHVQ